MLCGRSGADRIDAEVDADDAPTGVMMPSGRLETETDEADEGAACMELGAERTLERIVATVAVALMIGCVRAGFDPAHNSAVVGLVG